MLIFIFFILAGTSAERSSHMDEVCSQNLKHMEASEGLRTQIGLQKQLHAQLEVQRKMQLQVEEHSKYLEMVIARQGESLKQLGALPRFQHSNTQAVDHKEAYREETVGAGSEEESHPGKEWTLTIIYSELQTKGIHTRSLAAESARPRAD